MSFLSPWTIAVAAGLTVPPLIALYFLKLKRDIRFVPSTLLWRKSVEDLHVNSPFQRMRRSLLLLLQLLLLLIAALALGQPMLETGVRHRDALILLVDQSASMAVRESDGTSRLEQAKEAAKKCIDNLADGAQAMVLAFADRGTVVSSFDSDKAALRRKIDSIEQTHCSTTLRETFSLAEAYAQMIIIGSDQVGTDISSDPTTPPAQVFLFTDGGIEDLDRVVLERIDVSRVTVMNVGKESDNVAITAMDARRNYDRPEFMEVAAEIVNFSDRDRNVDAVLYIDGRHVDMRTVPLGAAGRRTSEQTPSTAEDSFRNRATIAFEDIEFTGAGVVQVALQVEDALSTDDRAWTVIAEPHRVRVLLVEGKRGVMSDYLSAFPIELTTMTGDEYESAKEESLLEGRRSAYDVVVLDRHSTGRLPPGNYFFWGAHPKVEGVETRGRAQDQVVFNWDESHPVLRYVGIENLQVYEWLQLNLPSDAVSLVDGESSTILAHLTRGSSQYLISAFSLVTENKAAQTVDNTLWGYSADFVIFLQNALYFLAGNAAASGKKSLVPGEPVFLQSAKGVQEMSVILPDGSEEILQSAGHSAFHFGATRQVGLYRVKGAEAGDDLFAVNLFNVVESRIRPESTFSLGANQVAAQTGSVSVNRPGWHWFLLAFLAVLLIEWTVYNLRVLI